MSAQQNFPQVAGIVMGLGFGDQCVFLKVLARVKLL